MMRAYEALAQRFRHISALEEATGMLQWDMSTVMPRGGAEARTEQLAALGVTTHAMLTDPAMADLIGRADGEAGALDAWRAANLREMHRRWRHATALEPALVEALAKATKRCEFLWRDACPKSDFAAVLPSFREVLRLVQEKAQAMGAALGFAPYDALLDIYEPGASAQRIDEIFVDLENFLRDFLPRVMERQGGRPAPRALQGPFAQDRQEALCRRLMQAVGFDFEHGRLDVSLHPFCGGVPDDVRITTRYDVDDFMKSLMGVLHETGHALYERGLPQAWRLQPVGQARGMAMHESQSLLIEMQACRSPEFMAFLAPLAREAFGGAGPAWEAANLFHLTNRVVPDFIRVDADEVTYPAHVILRYRLETAMIAGDLDPGDLPEAWAAGLSGLLGFAPPDDRLGCLQDIHWYDGAWGYFPTYTLGAMTAAQLFAAAKHDRPEIPGMIARGDFSPLVGWVREKVHRAGSSRSADEILAQATGRPLDVGVFKAHLRQRYLGDS